MIAFTLSEKLISAAEKAMKCYINGSALAIVSLLAPPPPPPPPPDVIKYFNVHG